MSALPNMPRSAPPMGRIRNIHMVGIGGIGMSSIAEVLLARGHRVTGSDLHKSEVTDHLEILGAVVYEGHAASNVQEADVVVYSSAVHADENPETVEAQRLHIPIIKRSEMLGELMRMKFGIGVAGTHGKTTTTTMVGLVAQEAGFDPTIIVGGKVAVFGSNAVSGEGDVIVIEADEYDRTFLKLTPALALITNIEAEHLDIYEDLDDIKEAFTLFANKVPFFGAAIICLDDPNLRAILGDIHRRVLTFGTSRQAEVRAENIEQVGASTHFDVFRGNEKLGGAMLDAPGMHNVLNALGAVAIGLELQVPFETIVRGLAAYSGVDRRFQIRGEAGGVIVVDDYAHHPTEVIATLDAATAGWPERRIVAVFQPHLYSRTADLAADFARAFVNADVLVLLDIYGAREKPIEGVDGMTLVDLARRYGHRAVHYVPQKTDLPAFLLDLVESGDLVITMGAGDIWRQGKAFYEQLVERNMEVTF